MATITFRTSTKSIQSNALSLSQKSISKFEILVRFRHGKIDQYGKTNIFTPVFYFDELDERRNLVLWNDKEGKVVIPQWRMQNDYQKAIIRELTETQTKLSQLSEYLQQAFIEAGSGKSGLPKDWLKSILNAYNFQTPVEQPTTAQEEIAKAPDMMALFDTYIEKAKISEVRKKNYRVVVKALKRYQLYKKVTLTFDGLTTDTLRDFEDFLRQEHTIYQDAIEKVERAAKRGKPAPKTYLDIFAKVEGSRPPEPRGGNAISSIMKKFRAFIRWANGVDKDFAIEPFTNNNPFDKYTITSEEYGTPFYLTQEERNQLFEAELPPRLARQRDIFIFQCLIGCRVSDLWAMTKANIINGAIEYIPRKTKDGRPVTVRVPLNEKAKKILSRYPDGEKLLPFVAQQQYNEDIKEMIKLAGITRMVTILNPTTRQEEKRPIYEVSSSHTARKTFVGNLYRQVPDPNLVGKLSGHAENSKAFVRYRDIDDEMAQELVSLLDWLTDEHKRIYLRVTGFQIGMVLL